MSADGAFARVRYHSLTCLESQYAQAFLFVRLRCHPPAAALRLWVKQG
jgi:hypothetical protein